MPPPLVVSTIGLSPVLAPGRHEDDQDDQDVVGDDQDDQDGVRDDHEDDSCGGLPPPRRVA